MHASSFCKLTLNVIIVSFITKNPLNFLSRFDGRTWPTYSLKMLSSSLEIYLLASAMTSITTFDISTSCHCASPYIQPPLSFNIGSNLDPLLYQTFVAIVSISISYSTSLSLHALPACLRCWTRILVQCLNANSTINDLVGPTRLHWVTIAHMILHPRHIWIQISYTNFESNYTHIFYVS